MSENNDHDKVYVGFVRASAERYLEEVAVHITPEGAAEDIAVLANAPEEYEELENWHDDGGGNLWLASFKPGHTDKTKFAEIRREEVYQS